VELDLVKKLHEHLITQDEAPRTIEHANHFVLHSFLKSKNRVSNVAPDFEYVSNKNSKWLTTQSLFRIEFETANHVNFKKIFFFDKSLARKFPLPIKLFYKLFRVYRMKIGIIGVNFKSADLFFREKLALSLQVSSPLFSALNHSKVILSTCNRFEIYFFSENLTETHSELLQKFRAEFESDCGFKLYSYFGQDCFSHLCRVTAGLDSAVLVETEIQGQVKRAYLKAQETPLAKELHFIFQKV